MTEGTEETKPAKGGLLSKILVVGFMGLVILGECVFAYLFIPGPDRVTAHAEDQVAAEKSESETDEEKQAKHVKSTIEVDLGRFSVTTHQPTSNATLRVDFHLVGTVLEKHKSSFGDLYQRNTNRFRDLVLIEVRNSSVADLTDPGLGLIKRRILEKSNALIGEPMLHGIVFSEFSFVDQ